MRYPPRTAAVAAAVAVLLALTASPAAAKSYFAERFDSLIRVMPGGALEVTETVVYRFESGTFDHVFRELPTRLTDGIEIVRASMDGRPFPAGNAVDRIEVSGNAKVRVQWRFAPVSESTHVFVLTYLARGVVRQAPDADVLEWHALPREHQYRIDASAIEFVLPGTAGASGERAATPATATHRLDGTVTVSVERGPDDVTAPPLHARITADRIRSDGWVESSFRLPKGSVITAPPAWQQSAITAAAFAPRWIAAAAMIVLAGLVLLFGLRQQYDSPPADLSPMGSGGSVPDALAPGLAGSLVSNGRTTLEHAMGTVFALAERDVIAIAETRGRFGVHSFDITRRRSTGPLAPHEQALLAALFDERHPEQTPLSGARNRVMRRLRRFGAAVQQELAAAGLLDMDRKRVRDRYIRVGIVLLILAGLSVPIAGFFVRRFAGWPMLLPAGIALVAVASFIFAGSTTPLSNEGVRRGARWRGFRAYLKEISHQRDQPAVRNLDVLLPFAIATGLGPHWARYIKKHPGSVPVWFRALSNGSRDRAFTAFVTSSAAHGGGGGGAGAGAAGGGASGAG